jgi:hypothetical protein
MQKMLGLRSIGKDGSRRGRAMEQAHRLGPRFSLLDSGTYVKLTRFRPKNKKPQGDRPAVIPDSQL